MITLFDNGTHKIETAGRLPTAEETAYLGTKIATRAFMQRFTRPERTAIRKSTDDIVIDIHEDLKALRGRHVVMDDPDTLAALVYLTGVGILVAGRSDTILNTPITEDEV